jgi:hypothetical protein
MHVAFVVNGGPRSPMGERAGAFSARLATGDTSVLLYRDAGKLRSIARIARALFRERPDIVYVLDVAYSGIAAALVYTRARRRPLVVDTGDAVAALARSLGRGAAGRALSAALERVALAAASHVVVRGTRHAELLRARGIGGVTVVQDGVEPSAFAGGDGRAARRALEIPDDAFVVGLVGSSVWSPVLDIGYGWELVELLRELPDPRVIGVLVGDGSGLAVLRERAARYGVTERLRLPGRIPLEALPGYLQAMDVCISTQTNDEVGQVRTTGKLPLYLAAGRRILASDVGEASLVLDAASRVRYDGQVDRAYPARLAERVRAILAGGAEPPSDVAVRHRALARERFDYDVLGARIRHVLADVARSVAA